jgi:uncharacterized protein (DUF1015 family)
MAQIAPFPAWRYDASRVGVMADVIAPPYDVISPAEQAALYERSPYNVVRLILARDAERADAAAGTLRGWIDQGVLAQEAAPAVYLYSQRFTLPDGRARRRDGVLCRLRLEDFSSGVVRPHERTFPGPKRDRLALMRATGAYLSPIFGLYARPGEPLRDVLGPLDEPLVDAEVGGTGHRVGHTLWRVSDSAAVARLQAALAAETIFIADGHHRYETGLAYRDECGGRGDTGWILACLANMEEEGLVVLPTHRLVRPACAVDDGALLAGVGGRFDVEPLAQNGTRPTGVIDVVLPGRRLRLRPTDVVRGAMADLPEAVRGLEVAMLREALLEPLGIGAEQLEFTHDDAEAAAAVASGRAAAAFLMNPPSMAAVRAVCLSGEVMPEKSTYFYPKLADGLVFDLVGPPWR